MAYKAKAAYLTPGQSIGLLSTAAQPQAGESPQQGLLRRAAYRNSVIGMLGQYHAQGGMEFGALMADQIPAAAGNFNGLYSLTLSVLADPNVAGMPAGKGLLQFWKEKATSPASDSGEVFYDWATDQMTVMSADFASSLRSASSNGGAVVLGSKLAAFIRSNSPAVATMANPFTGAHTPAAASVEAPITPDAGQNNPSLGAQGAFWHNLFVVGEIITTAGVIITMVPGGQVVGPILIEVGEDIEVTAIGGGIGDVLSGLEFSQPADVGGQDPQNYCPADSVSVGIGVCGGFGGGGGEPGWVDDQEKAD